MNEVSGSKLVLIYIRWCQIGLIMNIMTEMSQTSVYKSHIWEIW